jgi:2-polyprenyl-3-methyl-5-hydroxy-6-metoxy-1,4-benzoquinol methylase
MHPDAKQPDGTTPKAGGVWRRVLARSPFGKIGRRRRERPPIPREEFRSAEYWEDRYKTGGNSGLGSYGKLAAFKAQFINGFIREHQVKRLLDLGCGDGNQAASLEIENYLGFDVSPSAVQRCRKKFKGDASRRFLLYEQATYLSEAAAFKADLAISMDVVFHLVEEEIFARYMDELFHSATRHVIIYSTNFDKSYPLPHQIDRHFTAYLERRMPDWELTQTQVNPYKGIEVQADFFIYTRKTPGGGGSD